MDLNQPKLFRQVAIEAAAGTQFGEPLAAHWRGVKLFTIVAFCLVGLLLAFVATVEYSPIHRVPSYTDVRDGVVRLGAPTAGQVLQLSTAEGRLVRKGELLAVLGSDVLRADGGSEYRELKTRLVAEREMIERELAAADQESAANQTMIERRLLGLRAEQGQLQVELESSRQLEQSLKGQRDKVAGLFKQGYATELQLAQKRDEAMLQQGRVAAAQSALSRLQRDIATSQAERQLVEAKRSGLIENRRRQAGELERLIVQSEANAQQVVRAPVDGTISTALIAPGQSVREDQLLFTITPLGEPLVVRLVVPARAVAAVRPNMQIKLVFSAYPRERFGEFAARVDSVSETPSLPADIERVVAVNEPVFIAVASLPTPPRGPSGEVLKIKPGMVAEALVPIERRTVLAWMFEPLFRGFNQSAGRSSLATDIQ